ncbi:leishmanolysin-like peptidase [Diadema setosum]|uniref:leishmanolysin-like peptidase n=1 Tax=Diadema setosum TaxID=31175 RepID=UPI003B3A3BDA
MITAASHSAMEDWNIVLYVIYLCFVIADSHVCVHKPPQPAQVKFGVELESMSQRSERSVSHPLRIHVEYDASIEALSIAESTVIKTLLPKAVEFLSGLLSVKQSPSTVLLNRQCVGEHYVKRPDGHEYCIGGCRDQTMCGPVMIPKQHLQTCYACNEDLSVCGPMGNDTTPGEGSRDTDFILYVSAADYDCDGADMSAHASYCQLEAVMDRPIAGYVNLCPHHLATGLSKTYTLLTTIQHEIIHALGFSAALYAFYRDSNGQPLTPRLATGLPEFNATMGLYQWSENVIRPVTRTDWDVRTGQMEHTVNMIVTRKVVEEARAHFNCPTLEGVEVENHGGTGTEITHFEKRLLANEAMTGTHTHERIFSRLTLAVMEDTGWYVANYDRADPLHWGRNLGCDFVKKSCKYWMDFRNASDETIKPYCNELSQEPLDLTCDVGRAAVALCNLHMFPEELPPEYQYFDSLPGVDQASLGLYGGSSIIADYCPFYQQFTYQMNDGSSKGTVCMDRYNFPGIHNNLGAETYGTGSVCLDSPSPWIQQRCTVSQRQKAVGAGCYKVSCDKSRGLTIVIEGANYVCKEAGQVLDIQAQSSHYLHTGQLVCPPCEEVCGAQCPSPPYRPSAVAISGDPGECPRVDPDTAGICVSACTLDRDCGWGEKCCSNGCGHVCQRRISRYTSDPVIPCSASKPTSLSLVALAIASSLITTMWRTLLSS